MYIYIYTYKFTHNKHFYIFINIHTLIIVNRYKYIFKGTRKNNTKNYTRRKYMKT